MSKQHSLERLSDSDRQPYYRPPHYQQAAVVMLHNLCRSPALSIDGIKKAQAFHPLMFAARDMRGYLPLHVVCEAFKSGGGSVDVVKYLIELYPESVKERTEYGNLPLHAACWGGAPLQVVKYLYEQTPESVVRDNTFGTSSPLRQACCGRGVSPVEVIRFLVEKWPESVKDASGDWQNPNYFPLHLACERGAQYGDIPYLVEQWPEAVRLPDKMGHLPLHKVCLAPTPVRLEDIKCLVKQWPESIGKKDRRCGATPLHYLCSREPSVGVIRYLMEQWPEAVMIEDSQGRLPLHIACTGVGMYDYLLDHEARTPLEDIQLLVEQWPASVEVRNTFWGWDGDAMTPLSYAAQRSPPDIPLVNWLELPWRDRKGSRKRTSVPEPEEGTEERPTRPRIAET